MKKIRKDNAYLAELIAQLRKEPRPIWRRTAELLARSRRNRVEVNLSKLQTYRNSTILIPGKVLGTGELKKKLHVAAFAFSETARKTIQAVGGKTLTIQELKQAHPDGKGILLLA